MSFTLCHCTLEIVGLVFFLFLQRFTAKSLLRVSEQTLSGNAETVKTMQTLKNGLNAHVGLKA
jgi:hypothetical protein